jgi:hypothetical protein
VKPRILTVRAGTPGSRRIKRKRPAPGGEALVRSVTAKPKGAEAEGAKKR